MTFVDMVSSDLSLVHLPSAGSMADIVAQLPELERMCEALFTAQVSELVNGDSAAVAPPSTET